MSRVPSRPARAAVRSVAPSPAVAGFRPAAVAVAAALALGAHAQSVPIGAVHGTATYERNGNNLLVTTTNGAGNRSVINWQTFGVPGGSTTYFQQPDAASTSINRVLGGVRSDIFGSLGSNGRLVLVNPSGIAIGAGAMVDTAGFTASTLNLGQDDAIAGRLVFQGGTEGITVGEGARILAHNGDVVLVGSQVQVERNAVVRADGATILAAGEKVGITGRGLEGIRLEVQAGNQAVNLGTLQGDAVGIFAGTLKHSGLVQAQAVSAGGGKVVLQALAGDNLVDGTVVASAQGGKGGSIDLLGKRVGLLAGANVDASGATGGGSIRVGGDYQGKNTAIANAQSVSVDAAATLTADATGRGDGGRVIVWSDGVTRMAGRISARGGAAGGNGGFAEVSSRGHLDYAGTADLRAPMGTTGTLLLDPTDVHIAVAAGTDPSVSYVLESTLESNLATASVIVQAGAGSPDAAGASITVESGVNVEWSTNNALGLQADNSVSLLGNLTGSGSGSAVSIQALGGGVTQDSASAVTAFGLKVNAAGSIDMNGGNQVTRLSANSTLNGANGDISFRNNGALMLAQVATPYGASYDGVNAGTGNVMLNMGGALTQGSTSVVAANSLGVYSDSDVTLAGQNKVNSLAGNSSLTGGNGTFKFNNAQDLLVTQVAAGQGNVTLTTSAGSITVGDTPTYTPPPAVAGGQVTIEAAQDVILQRDVQASGLATINANAATGTINQLSGSVYASSVSMTAGNDITLNGYVRAYGGDITLTSNNGGITFNSLESSGYGSGPGDVNGGNITLQAKGNISGGYIDASGGYYYDGEGGDVAGNGGTVSATSGAGSITISSIYSRAGETEGYGVGGGTAGTVNLTTNSAAGDITSYYIDVTGDSGETATAGGNVNVLAGGNAYVALIAAEGGTSTNAAGAAGAKGGQVSVTAAGNLEVGYIHANGGNSTSGTGGLGGDILLKTGGQLTFFVGEGGYSSSFNYLGTGAQADGGKGGNDASGNGLLGGKGGTIQVRHATGDMTADSTWRLSAAGGLGGNAPVETTAIGGQGGDGGEVRISAPGRLQLASPTIDARGGAGGSNGDGSFTNPSGVNGTFRASGGSSVDVVSSFQLNADWINDSLVKVTGASEIYGYGLFQNNGDVELYDTARLNAYNGFVNAGRFSAFGSDNQANLTLNTSTGLVEVVAGSTLSTPAFLLNQGTVKIDGTLRTADPLPPSLDLLAASVPTSGPLFTNEATGTLTGNGTLVVGGGSGTVQNFGTIAPGGAGTVGMLTLDASLLMESGSTYAADLLNSSVHDSLVVTGSVASGGKFAVNYLSGASFSTGDSFTMLKSGGLDATTVPGVDKPELKAQASGNDMLLVATAAFPPPPPPPPAPAVQEEAVQTANNQVVTFADLFVKMSEDQDKKRIGKDDIVITDTACTR